MANYTIDDIEILRKKSGITYEEAVNLLEYHNGSLTRSLVDLEKNGFIGNDAPNTRAASDNATGLKKLFNTLFRIRLMVSRDGTVVANLSSLFVMAAVIFAPHVVVVGVIASLLLGYRVNVKRNDPAFAADNFDSMVKTARANVQNTMQGFSRSFSGESAQQENPDEAPRRPRSESAASGTRPVNVQFPGGVQVDVREDDDGYHEADIG